MGTWAGPALALLAAAGLALAVAVGRGGAPGPPPLALETVTVLPGVHHLGGLGPSPAYAVETPGGLVLVDAGLEDDAGGVKRALAGLGLDWRRTRALLLTHAHGDHTGGARRLREETGAAVHAGRGDADVLRAGGPKEAFFSTFDMPDHEPHPTEVDVALDGGEVLDFDGVAFEAIAAPGHTPGSVCYLLRRDGRRILFGGDVVMHPNDRDSLGTYSAYLAPRYRGDARAFRATLDRLRALEPPDVVLPGHPVQDPPRSPALAPGRWTAMIDEGIRELDALIARFDADGADFLDGTPKSILPGLDYLGDRDGAAVYAIEEAGKTFLVNAPGGPGLAAWASDRLRGLGRSPLGFEALLLTSGAPGLTTALEDWCRWEPAAVVAPAAALATLRGRLGPEARLVAAERLAEEVGLPASFLDLRGARYEAGYLLTRDGKRALLTGMRPVTIDREAIGRLLAEIGDAREEAADFLAATRALAAIEPPPDAWLPAVPSEGRNANLYDDAWRDLLDANSQLGYRRLALATGLPLPVAAPPVASRSAD